MAHKYNLLIILNYIIKTIWCFYVYRVKSLKVLPYIKVWFKSALSF